MKKKIVITYSIIHFLVDLACAILITNLAFQEIKSEYVLLLVTIFYNFFAFAMQLPIGAIADKINKNALCSAIGCLFVGVAFFIYKIPLLAAIISGIGNALFHVGGGIDVLNISEKKATLSGIYVSTGAMGIFLGSKSLSWNFTQYYMPILSLAFSSIALMLLYNDIKEKVVNEKVNIPKIKLDEKIAILCLTITVAVRGYMGFVFNFNWKTNIVFAIMATLAVVFGKMLGGIIGDKIGFMKISMISLIGSAIGFIFAFENAIIGLIAILLFNMTMPITLITLSNMLPKNKGMAFGILTFALFIGGVPIMFGYTDVFFNKIGLFGITMLSALILYLGLKVYNKSMVKNV